MPNNCIFRSQTPTHQTTQLICIILHKKRIFELDNFFLSKAIRSAPVVDTHNHLIGVITRRDALKALEKIVTDRADYKRQIKEPIQLSESQRIKVIINNR